MGCGASKKLPPLAVPRPEPQNVERIAFGQKRATMPAFKNVGVDGIPDGWLGLDVGPESAKEFSDVVSASKTVVWNGPMGVFEMGAFETGTKSMMDTIVEVTKEGTVTVIGGGDTGTDCIGTSLRHGAKSITNFELFPRPPDERAETNPWPAWPRIFRVDYGHEEASQHFGDAPRTYSILSREFIGDDDGNVNNAHYREAFPALPSNSQHLSI